MAGSSRTNASRPISAIAGRQPSRKIRLLHSCLLYTSINNPKAESVVARVKGLTENLNENFEIVEDSAITTVDEVLSKVDDALIAHPNLKFIFGLNDSCGLIALGSAQSAGRDVVVVSVDGSPDAQASISEGGLMATAAQSPITIGETIANTAYEWLDGKEVESFIPIDTFLVTADNVRCV